MGPGRSPDGRVARRQRNREAVLDAVLALFADGNLHPGPAEVARLCNLSPRSVYRYFEDRDALMRAAIDRQLELVRPLALIHAIGSGTFEDRLARFVTGRLRLYEAIGASARAARARADGNDLLREQVEATRRALREQVETHFATELSGLPAQARRTTAAAVDALCQPETLDFFRIARTLSVAETRAVLLGSLRALLRPA